jgi:DNA-binding transcriptional LysR family regulator
MPIRLRCFIASAAEIELTEAGRVLLEEARSVLARAATAELNPANPASTSPTFNPGESTYRRAASSVRIANPVTDRHERIGVAR